MKKTSELRLMVWGATAAFSTYACMYAFRKGITAATFEGMVFWGIDYKIWLITLQVLGYALSKLIGIKVVSEMKPAQRAFFILSFIGISELALLGFALVPAPYNIPFLFLNGLPLGMVYGTVLGFLEGRRQTDALVAGLTASFIFASGFVKTIGKMLLNEGVSEFWMPFVTGLLFAVPLVLAIWALAKLPAPTLEDQAERTERAPMNAAERSRFIQTFSVGLVLLICSYVLLSAFRDFRDNFAPEILRAAGVDNPLIFTQTETTVSVFILVLMGTLRWVKDNWRAFYFINGLLIVGGITVGVSTWLFQQGMLSAGVWFTLTGVGLYLAYVPCNGLYFERLVASFKYVSTVGFVVTLADWWGYLGSVLVLLYKNFGQPNISFLDFFIYGGYILAVFYVILVVISFGYFRKKYVSLQ
ncbi:DUF5690 family protein [Runella zeae]|uniref:DUF5690 family protein n=1 Tax=Runella zeae TaxID=94255 RepID=UPI0003FC2C3C|nr:DUF5690 family protein [Runella zeae]